MVILTEQVEDERWNEKSLYILIAGLKISAKRRTWFGNKVWPSAPLPPFLFLFSSLTIQKTFLLRCSLHNMSKIL